MSDQEHEPREQVPASPENAEEYRSATGTVIQAAAATGALAGRHRHTRHRRGQGEGDVRDEADPEPKQPSGEQSPD